MVRAEVRMTSAEYRDALKGGPVSLSNSQAGQGTNFSQPRAHLLVNPCIRRTGEAFVALAVSNLSLSLSFTTPFAKPEIKQAVLAEPPKA